MIWSQWPDFPVEPTQIVTWDLASSSDLRMRIVSNSSSACTYKMSTFVLIQHILNIFGYTVAYHVIKSILIMGNDFLVNLNEYPENLLDILFNIMSEREK